MGAEIIQVKAQYLGLTMVSTVGCDSKKILLNSNRCTLQVELYKNACRRGWGGRFAPILTVINIVSGDLYCCESTETRQCKKPPGHGASLGLKEDVYFLHPLQGKSAWKHC